MTLEEARQGLAAGEVVRFRPRGRSMTGRIEDGALVTLDPAREPCVGDAVLAEVSAGRLRLHLVDAIKGSFYRIANSAGRVDGLVARREIFGVVTKVEP